MGNKPSPCPISMGIIHNQPFFTWAHEFLSICYPFDAGMDLGLSNEILNNRYSLNNGNEKKNKGGRFIN
jgi:hypothetical protein